MKQICCTILLFFAFAGSHAQDFADYFQNKTLRVDYIFTGNAERQMNYRNYRLGQDGNTTFRNFHWRATDKSSLKISLLNKLFIRLLSLHCSMNG